MIYKPNNKKNLKKSPQPVNKQRPRKGAVMNYVLPGLLLLVFAKVGFRAYKVITHKNPGEMIARPMESSHITWVDFVALGVMLFSLYLICA
ncbi:hypothetical protein ACFL1M_03175 [Patescibacteria group bacterium]